MKTSIGKKQRTPKISLISVTVEWKEKGNKIKMHIPACHIESLELKVKPNKLPSTGEWALFSK